MKAIMTSAAADCAILQQPTLAADMTLADYLARLGKHVLTSKERISLTLFTRWLTATPAPAVVLAQGEAVVDCFASDLESGRMTGRRGRYRAMRQQAVADIFSVHNRACAAAEPGFLRPLLTRKTYRHLQRYARLTPLSQQAMIWFQEKGVSPPGKHGRAARPLTVATRKSSTYTALLLLEQLGLDGFEKLTPELVPEPSADDPEYKAKCRLLHAASTFYKACHAKGLLPANPLANVSHAVFANDAERDFIGPEVYEKLRDLSTVDRKDGHQVLGRLTVLLYADLAVRRNELAGVQLFDVKPDGGGYEVTLRSAVQKMQDKPPAVLGILFPETNELLDLYLRRFRGNTPGGLLLNSKGGDATGNWLARVVATECDRIGVRTYMDRTPSPHALRRGFATCNSAPLGLAMSTAEVASRLRSSIEVVYQHYVVQNPLMAKMKTRAYRKQTQTNPNEEARKHIEALAMLKFPEAILKPLRLELERRTVKLDCRVPETATWMDGADVLQRLREKWKVNVCDRKLRSFFRAQHLTDNAGPCGAIRYREDAVDRFLHEHVPADDVMRLMPVVGRSQARSVLARFVTLRIGRVVLLRTADSLRLMQELKSLQQAAPEELT